MGVFRNDEYEMKLYIHDFYIYNILCINNYLPYNKDRETKECFAAFAHLPKVADARHCQASVPGLAMSLHSRLFSIKCIGREGFAAKIDIVDVDDVVCFERSILTLGLDSENSEKAQTGLMTPKLSKARDFLF